MTDRPGWIRISLERKRGCGLAYACKRRGIVRAADDGAVTWMHHPQAVVADDPVEYWRYAATVDECSSERDQRLIDAAVEIGSVTPIGDSPIDRLTIEPSCLERACSRAVRFLIYYVYLAMPARPVGGPNRIPLWHQDGYGDCCDTNNEFFMSPR